MFYEAQISVREPDGFMFACEGGWRHLERFREFLRQHTAHGNLMCATICQTPEAYRTLYDPVAIHKVFY